jgi:aryl-alcohol dehydrogenase-like predicted oxidoreductase
MEYRSLGHSGLKVAVLSFGAGTFGGGTEFFRAWGETDVAEAKRLIDVCLDAGVNLFDTADIYSYGLSEEILGKAIAGKRNDLLIFIKTTLDGVAKETGKSVPQVALNWLLQRPTVSTVIFGARNEEQLRQNLGAADGSLTPAQVDTLDAASDTNLVCPYWHQRFFTERNPSPVRETKGK